jgi:hypothetical protein
MSEASEKRALLKSLTASDLKEICKHYNLCGYSSLKQHELASFLAKNLPLSFEEVEKLVDRYKSDKLIAKVRDSADYFLNKRVEIKYQDEGLIRASVGGYSVAIFNLGKENFSYICDDKCNDYLYQVKKGRYPFCKHYPAVIAELIFSDRFSPEKQPLNHIEGVVLEKLLQLVKQRRSTEGDILEGRDIEGTLKRLNADYLKIAKQEVKIAREKYQDSPEYVFENLTNQAFLLLDFDTITQRDPHGWDILLIAGRAVPPYIVVAECKTAANGLYDHLLHNPDYLVRLKSYCLDMVKEKLVGAYRDYVKYLIMVAPDFPKEISKYCVPFRTQTGIGLSFWPAHVLLYLVNRYREEPIVTHNWMEPLFQRKVLEEKDIDSLFEEAKEKIEDLTMKLREKLRQRFAQFSQISADASFLNLDLVIIESLMKDILSILSPELVVMGKKGVIGVDTINIKHDYFEIWKRVLKGLGEEFVDILREESFSQVKSPELKEDILKLLRIE